MTTLQHNSSTTPTPTPTYRTRVDGVLIHSTSVRNEETGKNTWTHRVPSAHIIGRMYTVHSYNRSWQCNCPATQKCWHIRAAQEAQDAIEMAIYYCQKRLSDYEHLSTEDYWCEKDLLDAIQTGMKEVQA